MAKQFIQAISNSMGRFESTENKVPLDVEMVVENFYELKSQFIRLRKQSLELCEPLAVEDYNLQAAPFVSPPKWNLAHSTWFFEFFVLRPFVEKYSMYSEIFHKLFNSYYLGVGSPFNRFQRGLLSRPTLAEVLDYRSLIDASVLSLLDECLFRAEATHSKEVFRRIELGIHHEMQHQELLLMDLKYSFFNNPLLPSYSQIENEFTKSQSVTRNPSQCWVAFDSGNSEMGAGGVSFHFDNEAPRHRVWVDSFQISNRLVTKGEYLEFIRAGAYEDAQYWLSDGWDWIRSEKLSAPLYWVYEEDGIFEFTLGGLQSLRESDPLLHVSYYEADAFARWKGARLPREEEWEVAFQRQGARGHVSGTFLEDGILHPQAPLRLLSDESEDDDFIYDMLGSVWEWTSSAYAPYPGFKSFQGEFAEYNGKFMANQYVLRGGSCISPRDHIRPSYRNFFYPKDRWSFSGIRLARDLRA